MKAGDSHDTAQHSYSPYMPVMNMGCIRISKLSWNSSNIHIYIYIYYILAHLEPFPFRGTNLWSQGINSSLPRYTPCILVSRIGSALPHRVNSHQQTQSTTFVYSRSHAFHGRNHTLRRKTQRIGNRTLDFYPNGEIRTIRRPERGSSASSKEIHECVPPSNEWKGGAIESHSVPNAVVRASFWWRTTRKIGMSCCYMQCPPITIM